MRTIRFAHTAENMTPKLVAAAQSIKPDEEVLILFEKGLYNFELEGALQSDQHIPTVQDAMRNFIFKLENCSGVTVDGQGSEFMFHDKLFPFVFQRCSNITLKNFIADYSFPRYSQGTLIKNDETGFELAVNQDVFKITVDEKHHAVFHGGNYSYSTENLAILFANDSFGKCPWDYIFAGDNTNDRSRLPVGWIDTDAELTSSGIRFNYRPESRRLDLTLGDKLLFCTEPRFYSIGYFDDCKNTRLENVTVYRSGGMGFIINAGENFLAEHVVIQVRPGRDECRSTTADSFYFSQVRGAVTIRNSVIKDTLDDALNIHGLYTDISEILSGDSFKCHFYWESYRGMNIYRPGDELLIHDEKTQCAKKKCKVLESEFLPDGSFRLKIDGDTAGLLPGDRIENQTAAADFTFENNTVMHCPHIRVSDNGKIIIRNNYFENLFRVYSCDLFGYWRESGSVQDILVEGNTFHGCPNRFCSAAPLAFDYERQETSDVRSRNIRILNNRFEEYPKQAIYITSADDILIEGNTFDKGTEQENIDLKSCTNVQIRNNQGKN